LPLCQIRGAAGKVLGDFKLLNDNGLRLGKSVLATFFRVSELMIRGVNPGRTKQFQKYPEKSGKLGGRLFSDSVRQIRDDSRIAG
jgi:hypothetical protein